MAGCKWHFLTEEDCRDRDADSSLIKEAEAAIRFPLPVIVEDGESIRLIVSDGKQKHENKEDIIPNRENSKVEDSNLMFMHTDQTGYISPMAKKIILATSLMREIARNDNQVAEYWKTRAKLRQGLKIKDYIEEFETKTRFIYILIKPNCYNACRGVPDYLKEMIVAETDALERQFKRAFRIPPERVVGEDMSLHMTDIKGRVYEKIRIFRDILLLV